jgi:glycine betaine transporter
LVPFDFSPCSEAALPYAATLARKYGARIILLHVIPTQLYVVGEVNYWQLSEKAFLALNQEALTKLSNAFSPAERDQLDIVEKVVHGIPVMEILREAIDSVVDLIVMGTHGRTGVSHLMLGSVAEQVVRQASCPVLTVHAFKVEKEAEVV